MQTPDRTRNSAWQIRHDAPGLFGVAQAGDLPQSADPEQPSARSGTDHTGATGVSDEIALLGTGRGGGTEEEGADAVSWADKPHLQSGRKSHLMVILSEMKRSRKALYN